MTRASEIILHVGLAKTGTTAIQQACLAQKKMLLGCDVLYPGDQENHCHFQSLFAKDPHRLIQVRRLALASPLAERAYLEGYREAFEREVACVRPSRIVLSSEYFPSMDEEELTALAGYLRQFANRLRVLAYVRDPWSMSLSQGQQELRDGLLEGGIRFGYRGDSLPMLEKLERGLDCTVDVRVYRGEIVRGFGDWIGVTLVAEAARANPSMGFEAACVLAVLNERFPQYVDGQLVFSAARDWIVDAVMHAFPADRPIRMSKATARWIYSQSLQDLRAICDRYFEGRQVFDEFYNDREFTDEDDMIDASKLASGSLIDEWLSALRFLAERGVHFHGQLARAKNSARVISLLSRKLESEC